MKSKKLPVILSAVWMVATFSLVAWWFIYSLTHTGSSAVEDVERRHRMFFWEGGTLLSSVFFGGIVFVFYVYRDFARHEKLRIFFANFSHEMKTAISRLRLQTEILAENDLIKNTAGFDRLLKELTRLDLQLENSLLLSHVEDPQYLKEQVQLDSLLAGLQLEFEKLIIQVNGNAILIGDRRALRSVFRNIIENSLRHGKAKSLEVSIRAIQDDLIEVRMVDDGDGTQRNLQRVGLEILSEKENDGNGIGLYLSQRLMKKMSGELKVESLPKGFLVVLRIKGKVTSSVNGAQS